MTAGSSSANSIKPILLALLLALAACGNDLEEARRIVSRPNARLEFGKEVEIIYSGGARPRIRAKAPSVVRHDTDKPYLEFNDGINLWFYDAAGNIQNKLKAGYATAVENSSEMTVRRNVEVINNKGDKLQTEELIWDEQRKIIYSNAFVRITTRDEVIFGQGMTANQEFTDYSIRKISGRIKIKK